MGKPIPHPYPCVQVQVRFALQNPRVTLITLSLNFNALGNTTCLITFTTTFTGNIPGNVGFHNRLQRHASITNLIFTLNIVFIIDYIICIVNKYIFHTKTRGYLYLYLWWVTHGYVLIQVIENRK